MLATDLHILGAILTGSVLCFLHLLCLVGSQLQRVQGTVRALTHILRQPLGCGQRGQCQSQHGERHGSTQGAQKKHYVTMSHYCMEPKQKLRLYVVTQVVPGSLKTSA